MRCRSVSQNGPSCEGMAGHLHGHWFGLMEQWHDNLCCGQGLVHSDVNEREWEMELNNGGI